MLTRRCIREVTGLSGIKRMSTTSSAASKVASARSSSYQYQRILPIILSSSAVGFALGRQSLPSADEKDLQLPNGLPRTCCEKPELTEQQKELFTTLKRIVGKANVLDGREETTETAPFLKGARIGKGAALYIVKPNKLKQLVEIVQAVVDADCVVLVQGQNTGLVRFVMSKVIGNDGACCELTVEHVYFRLGDLCHGYKQMADRRWLCR